MHTPHSSTRATAHNCVLDIARPSSLQDPHGLMHKCWKCCCLWALTQDILHIIVPIFLESIGSYVKLIVGELVKINKPHNIQNITGYVTSTNQFSVRFFLLFFC